MLAKARAQIAVMPMDCYLCTGAQGQIAAIAGNWAAVEKHTP